ncbi:MAG: riboflavin synthase [Bacillota bacterium]
MFTGIVEELGTINSLRRGADSAALKISARTVLENLKLGDSIAVNGVCLTVTSFNERGFSADVMAETLAKTNLGNLCPGDRVNLERALALGDRLGGHLVSGHIDGVGSITGKARHDIASVVTIAAPPGVMHYIINKGSVAIDGISLTVVDYGEDSFRVSLIPHTASATTLGFKQVGDSVNLEGDMIGKYIEKWFTARENKESRGRGISAEFLARHGFL